MAQGTILNIAVGIAVCLVITTVLTDGRTEQMTIEKIVERLQEVEAKVSEQAEEIQSQKLLIQKQAKQIEELTNMCMGTTVDYSEKADDSVVQPENSSKDEQFHNDMITDSLKRNQGAAITERDSRTVIRTSRQNQGMVAFTAYLSHDEEFKSGQILIFDKSDEIKSQKLLIDKQAKQIEELTKHCMKVTDDYSEESDEPFVPSGDIIQDKQLKNYSRKVSSIQKTGHVVTEREPNADIRTARQVSGMVAFTAYLSHHEEFTSGQILVFDKVITNEGGAYSQYSGIFTAPTDGVYMFIYFIGQRGVYQVGIDLVLNDQRLVGAVVEGTTTYHDLQGGNSVIVRLKKGDGVWARRRYGTHVEGGPYERTSFSGFLMY